MSTPFTSPSPSSLLVPSTTATPLSTSPPNLNWFLKMAGYDGAAPTYTAPSTAPPGIGVAEAAAAVVAEIAEEAAAGAGQHLEATMTTTAVDRFGEGDGLGMGTLSRSTTGGGFSFGNRGNRGFRGIGNVFNYLTSSWALLCIFMAILLNRTLLYASLRRPTRLNWKMRLAIRIIPIVFFLSHIRSTLYALRCQTSPHLALEAYPLAASIPYNFDEDRGGFLYVLSRILTPWLPTSESDPEVCQAFGMLPPPGAPNGWTPTGSLTILWPLYRTISIALFLSTFSHALQGPTSAGTAIPSTSSDTGLTLFEDSLAFAEAEALVDPRSGNVSPEVLYIALISALAHLTANIIGVLVEDQPGGIRPRGVATVGRYRLITTGIWGVAFLGGFTWVLWRGGAKVLGFPSVCVVGFIPHLMVMAGIAICGAIYLLAALFSALAPPPRRGLEGLIGEQDNDLFISPAQFDGAADEFPAHRGYFDFSNLQANITLSTLTISWSEDFYTSLLKLGFQCLTAASEATYLNEGAPLRVPGLTWLERERIRVLERQRKWDVEKKALENCQVGDAEVAMFANIDNKKGYGNEKKEIKGWMVGLPRDYAVGAGGEGGNGDMANERSRGRKRRKLGNGRAKRWVGAVDFVRGLVGVLGIWVVRGVLRVGKKIGVLSGEEPGEMGDGDEESKEWEDKDDTENDLDEAAMQILGENWVDGEKDEEHRKRLYEAFLQAKTLLPQEEDDSGEYIPWRSSDDDRDSSSTVTTTSYSSSLPHSSSSYSYRSRSMTPTLETPCPPSRWGNRHTTTLSVDSVLDDKDDNHDDEDGDDDDTGSSQLQYLAVLLNPQTPEQRSLARIMSSHLAAPRGKHVTRRSALAHNQEEEVTLERLILQRRRGVGGGVGPGVSAGDGRGEGEGWGLCVVCQMGPRTVVVWPCKCLALCEECRVIEFMRFRWGSCMIRDFLPFLFLYFGEGIDGLWVCMRVVLLGGFWLLLL
ncbi:hypothetical protein L211DRAFT_986 [Terfezia boudieri ATCC MYA-4762]|uniref:Uncharacterized protein n=1 Tax=Terfezia boudieri ATCC MYA-4762 TaxID=1051890 RepID=A0A3N4M292_9PEZI|nr:hypothetical protein L211DRAFT_986 [Terfezia boudieri ATCC MYA-4762]